MFIVTEYAALTISSSNDQMPLDELNTHQKSYQNLPNTAF